MEDNSFLYFTQDEIIEKINIDSRLVESFKRVMAKIQEYYNANGYTKQRDFKSYMQKYFLDSGENNFRIYVNAIDKKGVGGFYSKYKNEICINIEKLNGSTERLDSTLCHEFTHFLVMHELNKDNSETEISKGGFINEALTEMMTQQMYPNSRAYDAQVAMQKFANLLSNRTNNYSRFLQGSVDAKRGSYDWDDYFEKANLFQKDFNEKGYINLLDASYNKNYIEAQRSLIQLFIKPKVKKSFDEYCECIKKLMDRPVADRGYINEVVSIMDKTMIKSLGFNNENINKLIEQKLIEVREVLKEQKKDNGRKKYDFVFAGRKLSIDSNLNITGNVVGIQRQWNPTIRTLSFQMNNEYLQLKIDELDFDLKEKQLKSKLDELSSYFSKDSKKNMLMLQTAMQQSGKLSKIEKFTLPVVNLNGKKTPYTIYVATYDDKIVLLNNYEQLQNINNIKLNKFIGLTSLDPSVGAIYSNEIGLIDSGIVFSTLNEKQIENKAINIFSNDLMKSLSQAEFTKYIQQYKMINSLQDEKNEIIKDEALFLLAKEKWQSLNQSQKQEFLNKAKSQSDKFVISTIDGKVNVSTLFGSDVVSAFVSDRQVLYDVNGIGTYNTIYEEMYSQSDLVQLDDKPSLAIDSNGNIKTESKNVINEDTDYKTIISQIEKLLGIQITSTGEFIYDNNLKVPRIVLKDSSTLSKECGSINRKLEQLFYNGDIDLRTYNLMKMAVLKEYETMIAKAPKPFTSTISDSSNITNRQEESVAPIHHPYITPEVKEQVMKKDLNNQFNHKHRKTETKPTSRIDDKKDLEKMKQELLRKQLEERAKAMGIDLEQIANLDNIFLQELLKNQISEESEEIGEHHGMMM